MSFSVRFANEEDTAALKELWHVCFPEDTAEDIELFFNQLFPLAICLVGIVEDKPIAMVNLLPATVFCAEEALPVRYLYGGCTSPAHRGRGWYSALLQKAATVVADNGEYAIYLHPATDSLVPLYRHAGYREGIGRAAAEPNSNGERLTDSAYIQCRRQLLLKGASSYVCWEPCDAVAKVFMKMAELYPVRAKGDLCLLHHPDASIVDVFPPGAVSDTVAMWLPTRPHALLEKYMRNIGGYTALLGE